jgi:hypothetical protein
LDVGREQILKKTWPPLRRAHQVSLVGKAAHGRECLRGSHYERNAIASTNVVVIACDSLVLYMANAAEFEKMMKNSTPEQQKKGMDARMKWMGDHKVSLVDGGAPLGKTKRVDLKGAKDAKNELGGYSIVQAESADAATKIFGKDQPHLQMPGAWIEIIEIIQMRGM